MDYFQDLTYYSRFHFENAKNIGFGPQVPAEPAAALPEGFIGQLAKHLDYAVNGQRGFGFRQITVEGKTYPLGFSEIRVLGRDGTVYAAPDEVVADIQEGAYLPPAEFVDAVMNGIDPESEAYQQYISRYNGPCCWGASNEYVQDVVAALNAISADDLPGLQALLKERPARLELVAGDGSLLNEAINRGKEEIARYLVKAGIRLDKFEGAELLTAAETGSLAVVQTLVAAGAPVKMDLPRNNPLFLAIGRNQNQVAQYLYEARPDLVVTYNTEYTQDCNILQWTKLCKNQAFMDFMLNRLQSS